VTIAGRIIVLFLASGLFLISIATAYLTNREYDVALQDLVDRAIVRAQDRPELEYAIYRENTAVLKPLLQNFLDSEATTAAWAFNSQGDELTSLSGPGGTAIPAPSLASIRSRAAVPEITLVAFDKTMNDTGTGFWSTLIAEDPTLYLSIPIFSPLGPVGKNLGLSDFAAAQAPVDDSASLVVIGYLNLALDHAVLLRDVSVTANWIFMGSFLLLILATIPVYLYSRQTMAPITGLNAVASQYLSGNFDRTLSADPVGEYRDIALVINNAIKNSFRRNEEVDLERKLLQLTAGERASQLSQREEELNRVTAEISATREELHRLANYDHLTSLPNRELFSEQLGLLLRLCSRDAKPLAILILNIDNFHRINDSLGRSAGDALLQEVGKRLERCLRSGDVLAHNVKSEGSPSVSRLSGDEFALVVGQLENAETAGVVAQRIIEQLMQPMTVEGHELVVVPKVGIATAPRNGLEVDELLRYATTAMHHARSVTGGSFLFYKDDMEDTGHFDIKMEAELRKAIERDELSLHYQPQVDTTNGSIVCAEALLRWEHPEFGDVSPAQFIQLAEETGLIWELGDWVVAEVCQLVSEFTRQGIELPRVAVNISPQQIQLAFVERLGEMLKESGIAPDKLELGLSEAILVNRDSTVVKFLQQLKELGVYLSLENFGTSHAPISYLSRYPLDEIKIDRSFVAGCDQHASSARLVKAIIAMSNSLGLPTVAEGVETVGECRFLSDNGVIKMRGYLFSKPVPSEDLRKLLAVPWHYMGQIQKMAQMAEMTAPRAT